MLSLWAVTMAGKLVKINRMSPGNKWKGDKQIDVYSAVDVRAVAVNPQTGALNVIDRSGQYRRAPCIRPDERLKTQEVPGATLPLKSVASGANTVWVVDAKGVLWSRANGGSGCRAPEWGLASDGGAGRWLQVSADESDQLIGIGPTHDIFTLSGPYVVHVQGKLVQISIDKIETAANGHRLVGVTATHQLYYASDWHPGRTIDWKRLGKHSIYRWAVVHDGEIFAATIDGLLVHHTGVGSLPSNFATMFGGGGNFETVYEMDIQSFDIGPATAQDIPPITLPPPDRVYDDEARGIDPVSALPHDEIPAEIRDVWIDPITGEKDEEIVFIDPRDAAGRPLAGGRSPDTNIEAELERRLRKERERQGRPLHTQDGIPDNEEIVPAKRISRKSWVIIAVVVLTVLLLAAALFFILRKKRQAQQTQQAAVVAQTVA